MEIWHPTTPAGIITLAGIHNPLNGNLQIEEAEEAENRECLFTVFVSFSGSSQKRAHMAPSGIASQSTINLLLS